MEEEFYNAEFSGATLRPGDACAGLLRFQRALRDGAVFLGADYVDYNIHEAPKHQKSMAEAVVNVVRKYHTDEADVEIFDIPSSWWIESFLNQYRGKDMLKMVQGLGSGARVTDLFNTLFNVAVFEICSEMLQEAGLHVEILLRTHQGDDTNLMLKELLHAVLVYYGLSALGMKLNPFKQLISIEWAEYIRRVITKNQ
eukprot:5294164-Amphidinium_carterae.2